MSDRTPSRAERASVDDLNRYLRRMSNGGGWFQFHRCYAQVMSLEAAVVFQQILNCGCIEPKSKTAIKHRRDGWIMFTVEYVERVLFINAKVQRRILDELSGKGFIERTKKGQPGRRYVRIDPLAVHQAIDRVSVVPKRAQLEVPEQEQLKVPKRGLGEEDNRRKTKTTPTLKRRGDKILVKTKPTRSLKQATRLYEILKRRGKLMRKSPNLSSWAAEFREMNALHDHERVDAALDWYEENIGRTQFIPAAYSAKAFRIKFPNIEDAMKRDGVLEPSMNEVVVD